MSDLPDIWEDRGKIVFDSGLEEEFLENIHYIELDKFRKNVQTITNEKECWLSLFSADTPVIPLTALFHCCMPRKLLLCPPAAPYVL